MWSCPPASTATVPVARQARCAAASMPRASPEAITNPDAPRSRASCSANLSPAAEAFRPPDDRDHRSRKRSELAAYRDERRRVVDHCQSGRIVGLAERDMGHAEQPCPIDLALGLFPRPDSGKACRAAAPGQRCGERSPRAAIMREQRAERPRPDVLAADESQPVDPLLIGEVDA